MTIRLGRGCRQARNLDQFPCKIRGWEMHHTAHRRAETHTSQRRLKIRTIRLAHMTVCRHNFRLERLMVIKSSRLTETAVSTHTIHIAGRCLRSIEPFNRNDHTPISTGAHPRNPLLTREAIMRIHAAWAVILPRILHSNQIHSTVTNLRASVQRRAHRRMVPLNNEQSRR